MLPIRRDYRCHPSTVGFHNSHRQVKALCGPVGSGKSSSCCVEIMYALREAAVPLHWIVIRESYRQLHDSTRRTWEEWFGHCSRYLKSDEKMLVSVENVDGQVLEHEIDFRHARRPEEASNLLSTEYAGAWLEEPVPAYQMSEGVIGAGLSKELFDMVLMRLRQKGAHRPHILLSFNPPHRFHWVYKAFFAPTLKRDDGTMLKGAEALAALDYDLYRAPAYENVDNLRPGYYQDLLKRLDPEMVRRFVMGEPVTLYPGVRVFPEAYEQKHFREYLDVVPGVELVIAFDFGLTPCALIGQTLPNGRLQIYREVQLFNAGIERLAEALQETLKEPDSYQKGARFKGLSWRCWGDPAGAQRAQTDEKTCYEILAQRGFRVQPGAVDWEARRQVVKQRLERMIDGEPAVLIDQQGCPMLSEGLLGGYRYPRSTDNRVMARPLKNSFSHVADALQYLCTGEFSYTSGVALRTEDDKPKAKVYNPLADTRSNGAAGGWMSG